MLKVLFLHQNCPGQFREYSLYRQSLGDEVVFISERKSLITTDGIRNICALKGIDSVEGKNYKIAQGIRKQLMTAEIFRRKMERLKQRGWEPDLIVSHSGWGCGCYAKEVFPQAIQLSYCEWYFTEQNAELLNVSTLSGRKIIEDDMEQTLRERNIITELEIERANYAFTPTKWQHQQFPKRQRDKIKIIHEGINIERWTKSRREKKEDVLLVTYASRGYEDVRMFSEFIDAAIYVAKREKECKFRIIGSDRICYGGQTPKGYDSFGEWASDQIKKNGLEKVIEIKDYMDEENFIKEICKSDLHVYASLPYILSWSAIQIASCGIDIATIKNEMTKEIDWDEELLINGRSRDEFQMTFWDVVKEAKVRRFEKKQGKDISKKIKERYDCVKSNLRIDELLGL